MLPIRAAAKAAGISESSLRRLVQDGVIEAVRQGGSLHVTHATVVELRSGGRKRGPSPGLRALQADRGETAAECFKRFRAGVPLTAIVEEIAVDPLIVEGLWNKWRHLESTQFKASPPQCVLEGHGHIDCTALTPTAGLCSAHASRARILSREEEATLHAMRTGKEIAKAVCCDVCGDMAAHGVCNGCMRAETRVTVEKGLLTVRIGTREIAILSIVESTALAQQVLGGGLTQAPTAPVSLSEPAGLSPSTLPKNDIDILLSRVEAALAPKGTPQ
jgi:hypothetical protein